MLFERLVQRLYSAEHKLVNISLKNRCILLLIYQDGLNN